MGLYEERLGRLTKALSLEEPDRVPFAPKLGLYTCNFDQVNVYSVMKDYRFVTQGIKSFVDAYSPDILWPPAVYPIDTLEVLGTNMIKWPGPTHGLPLTSGFQHLDNTYLLDDEFRLFLNDPTHFIITKLLPRKHKGLKGLEKVSFNNIYDVGTINDLGVFADEDVMLALSNIAHAGMHVREKQKQAAGVKKFVEESCSCPTRSMAICAPFDIYADSLRGLVRAVMDVIEFPSETLECIERIYDLCVPRAIETAKRQGERFFFIPLHAGVDQFMSREDYSKFYWPTLKRMILAIVDAGMTPYVFCEGSYNTRLDIISDVPKGKVIYMFEKADMKAVKETVGKVACICGNLSNTLLIYGKPEEVERETKQLIDTCAPGGGFWMDSSQLIDNANPDNIRAWQETTLKYGQY